MLGELLTSLTSLDDETRLRLANLLDKRNEYLGEAIKLNTLRITMLTQPTPANEQAASDFSSTVVAPLRDGMVEDTMSMLKGAVDVAQLKDMLPMIVMGVLQSLNMPLAFAALGIEPDLADKIIGDVMAFVKSGM